VSIIYGAWVERVLQINVVALGTASTIIGLVELSGEDFVALLVDRFGNGFYANCFLAATFDIITLALLPFFVRE